MDPQIAGWADKALFAGVPGQGADDAWYYATGFSGIDGLARLFKLFSPISDRDLRVKKFNIVGVIQMLPSKRRRRNTLVGVKGPDGN